MQQRLLSSRQADFAVEAYLLGQVDFDACLALQQWLVYEASGRADGQITLLVCEHPPLVTIGRLGSRAHVHMTPAELTSRRLEVRWVNRGGGCLLHAPGQLAIYPVVPLEDHELSVGQYLERLHTGLLRTLADLRIEGHRLPRRHGIWGRTGQLVAIGAAVKSWVTYHGAFINVAPPMHVSRFIHADPEGGTAMTSLVVERQQPVKMASVRASLVRHLAEALGCSRFHLYTGHPLLGRASKARHELAARTH